MKRSSKHKGIIMAQQLFSHDSYFTRPSDLLDEDLEIGDEPELDARWIHYCELNAHLDAEDLMAVIDDAFSQSDVLRSLIEDIKEHPYTPGERRHLHVMDAIKLGNEVARLISAAMDDAIGMRQACEEVR
jgi:hypothetical protein